jgi:hypothetical protein
LDSIYGHICTLHGIDKKYSIWKLLWLLITFKFKDFGEAFSDIRNQVKIHKENKSI